MATEEKEFEKLSKSELVKKLTKTGKKASVVAMIAGVNNWIEISNKEIIFHVKSLPVDTFYIIYGRGKIYINHLN